MGEAIESQGGRDAAVGVFLRNWERDPQNPSALRKLIESCRNMDDLTTAEAVRRRCLDEGINPGNDTTPREFALELADLLEGRGAVEEALAVITRAVDSTPGEMRLLYRQAQLLERAGSPDQADTLWMRLAKMDGGTAHARGALAQMLEKQGRFREAIEVRIRGGASGDTQLPVLLYKDGRTEEALAAFEKLPGSTSVYPAMMLAEVMALRGEGKLARSVLISAAARATDAKGQMQVRSKLLTIPGFPPTRGFVKRTQIRMRELAERQPLLMEAYFEFFDRYSRQFRIEAEWEREVGNAWADGRGISAAGIVLLRRQCANGDIVGAKQTCERLLVMPDVSGAMLEKLDALLRKAHRPELRPMVAEAIARHSWPFARGTLEWARLLDSQGSREEARDVLRRHEWLAGFPGGAEALGQIWLDLGDAQEARRFFVMAMRENAMVPSPSVLVGLARVHLRAGNLAAARLLLKRAFSQPSCHEFAALVEYLDAAGTLGRWSGAMDDFSLTPAALHEFKLALFTHFESRGSLHDALALIASDPSLVSPVGGLAGGEVPPQPVTCERVRALARKTAGFAEAAPVLELLAEKKIPDAAPQLEATYADWVEAAGDSVSGLQHLERAAALRPASWEFARRCAEIHLASANPPGAKAALERFLEVSQVPAERDAALALWELAAGESAGR
jgi:tetratricopeptide (TPR) repeat protein